MTAADLAATLRDLRAALGISQEQAAARIGIRRSAVSEIERGNRRVSAEELAAFAALYLTTADALLAGATPAGEGKAMPPEDAPHREPEPRRKSEQRQRAVMASVRLTPAELEIVQEHACLAGVGVSRYLRDLALAPPADVQAPSADRAVAGDGQFMTMTFTGFAEVTGYVTDITLGGEPAFHIDLPDKLWGGNPLAWEEWSAKALRSRHPVAEESVRRAWESESRAAEERARREAEWRRAQDQRALTAGEDSDPDYDWAERPGNFPASSPADPF